MLIFCCGMGNSPQDAPLSDKISSELHQLAAADDPQAFAKTHGISLSGDSVKVVIQLKNIAIDLTDQYGLKEIEEHKGLVEALVPVRSLVSLSNDENILYIRRPRKWWF